MTYFPSEKQLSPSQYTIYASLVLPLNTVVDMELSALPRIASVSGQTLNVEEISGLESSMVERKLEEKLTGKFQFWGKIFGSSQDYLIVQCVDLYSEFMEKKFYFW